MPLITEMFAFVVYDGTGEADEGVIGFDRMPLVGADLTRVESLQPLAQQIANTIGKQVRIYRFSTKEQIGEINPQEPA